MPDTELDRARAHLRQSQSVLVFERGLLNSMNADRLGVAIAERGVLCALSWVWDAQERAHTAAAQPFYDYLNKQMTEAHDATMGAFLKRLDRIVANGRRAAWPASARQPPKIRAKRSHARAA